MIFLARRAVKLALLLVVLLVVYLAVTLAQVWAAARRDEARPADAIVVFGAAQYDGRPSPVLQARLDHAAALYERDLAPTIVVTGGKQAGDRTTEASASAQYLQGKGVPGGAIERVFGDTSWQSLAEAARFLRAEGSTEVLLVSDPFHAKRIDVMATELGLESHVSPTRTSPIGGTEEGWHLVRESVAVGAGRVIGFRRLVGLDKGVDRVRDKVESG